MTSKAAHEELFSLITETREHVSYLQELGIENVEIVVHEPPPPARATGPSPAQTSSVSRTQSARVDGEWPGKHGPSQKPATFHPKQAATAISNESTLFADVFEKPGDRLPESNETFEQIHADIGDCTRCPLSHGRTHVVHTEGNPRARLMFVGEAPGADEDAQARPFVGRAGQLLTKIIEAIGLRREDVLIGNVNRCRPPGNRPPTQEEAAMCKPFLLREIAAARPEAIVVLGNTAMKNLLDTKEGITRLRGQFQNYKGIKVMPTFHPAYLLRDPSKKRETWDDLKKVRDYLDNSQAQ
jgi:uracil-DNA glycosylase